MVKVMVDDPMFKMGSYKGQKSDGLYMDRIIVSLVDILARKIVEDNQFVGIGGSSTFEVRTGKSTFFQQVAYFYTYTVNKIHNLDLKFDHRNIVFSSEDLIKRAYEVPKYSCLILDEGDDLTEHAFSKVMKNLQTFFRKAGQLNLFLLIILPSFFDVPKFLAMNRSNFFIDVHFKDEFERGHFNYYNFSDKRKLYVKGKKFHDYSVQKATVDNGRFVNKYCVDEKIYRQMKLDDLKKKEKVNTDKINPQKLRKETESDIFAKIYLGLRQLGGNEVSVRKLAKMIGRTERTGFEYLKIYKEKTLYDFNLQNFHDETQEEELETMKTNEGENDTINLTSLSVSGGVDHNDRQNKMG